MALASEVQPAMAAMHARPTDAHPRSGALLLALTSAIGVAAFLYPFLLARAPAPSAAQAHGGDAPLIFGLLAAASCALFVAEMASGGMNARVAAALAVLAVAAAALRLPPLPAGASAFFFLVIIGGYVFGARFGFLLGALALLLSSFVSGGLGPWVPFQMFGAGWMGLTAGWLGSGASRLSFGRGAQVVLLATFGALWGFLYGALMNLWFWPYVATGADVSWQPGMGVGETLQHYWSFYVLTSAGWDLWSAAVNAALILISGRELLRLLTRFRDRFDVRW